ncbi:MAG: SBBP repeat-containing protein [Bacteroidetes bacterium]|nr:SBBP repeat-containing protein [Bacteroidota bacterium]
MKAQTFSWSNHVGSQLGDYGRSGACDNAGNFYYAGEFEGLFCYFQSDTLIRQGINDLFLVKYDPSGNEQWVHRIGGENEYSPEHITVYYDNVSNNIFIAGSFRGTVSFGSCTLTSGGEADIFLAKYDLNGNCKWAKKAGGTGYDGSAKIAFDKNGNIYMCGTASSSATFDGFVIPKGGFLAKFDPSGNCLWAKNKFAWIHTFNSQIQIGGLKVFNSDIFLGGCTQVNATITIDTLVISHKGLYSSLICCFDSTGTAKWIREGISVASETISNIAIDSDGNIFHTGYFVDPINFNGNVITSSPGKQEMFLVKYNKNGQFRWARQTSGGSYAEGFNLTNTTDGKIVVVGHFAGSIHFGDFQVQSFSNEDMFLASYDSLGNCLGVYNYGNSYGTGICDDANGNLFFTMLFNPNTTLGSTSYNSYGLTDIILAKCSAIAGIEEPKINLKNQLFIYANPTTGKCTITIPEEFINEKYLTLQVFDSQGKLIQQAPVEKVDGKIKLNIEAQARGAYTALLGNGTKSYTGKIIFR